MQYPDYVAALGALLNLDPNQDTDFATFLPRIIEGAEIRCYRDLDPMAARMVDSTVVAGGYYMVPGPPGWIVGRRVRVISQAGPPWANLLRRDDSFLDEYAPDPTQIGQPKYWSEPQVGLIRLAPTPDQSYRVEMHFTGRPASMSAMNPQTWLGDNCPDLMLYASAVLASAYKRNFGAQADNPQMAMSWEQLYQQHLAAARIEEARRKGEGYFDVPPSAAPSSDSP